MADHGCMKNRCFPALGCAAVVAVTPCAAQESAPQQVTVSAARSERPLADLPLSADVLDASVIQDAQPRINLSESLARVPGIVAQNRQNYAQDLQISSRGFGARSTFGVRGLRFIVDGIPATLPDGQGQISHVDLGSAGRIEVLRGPFSALHGNAAGGVVSITTEVPPPGDVMQADGLVGSQHARRAGVKAMGAHEDGLDYSISASHFSTRGWREHSAAARDIGNLKLRWQLSEGGRLTMVVNSISTSEVQDPLGLTRAQFEGDPKLVDASAITFNTRKSVSQTQIGLAYERPFGAKSRLQATVYSGDRFTTQFQAIPVAAQRPATSPGGVIVLSRHYWGTDWRWVHDTQLAGGPLRGTAGVSIDTVTEDRLGYENFIGTTLGVHGRLRRDEDNRAQSLDPYLQLEWQPATRWLLLAGLRSSRVKVRSNDHFIVPGNGDDSGRITYRATSPVLGATFKATPRLNLYASFGDGFETPTLAELAYRSTDGSVTGMNLGLKAARSRHFEVGAKAQWGARLQARVAAFQVRTHDELAVQTNSGGRSVFQNIGRTKRTGVEAVLDASSREGLGGMLSVATLRATVVDAFCNGPCSTGQVNAGSRLPGAPTSTAYGELAWRHLGWEAAVEARRVGRVYVDDMNSDFAPPSTTLSLRAGVKRDYGPWRLSAFFRIENVADRRTIGSVIVNEGNRRFFEPAAGRTTALGASAAIRW